MTSIFKPISALKLYPARKLLLVQNDQNVYENNSTYFKTQFLKELVPFVMNSKMRLW